MLMKEVPLSYKIHVIAAWTLLGFSPFSRLVHIWSLHAVFYFFRSANPVTGAAQGNHESML